MFFTKVRRVIKAGFVNFWRNGWVSLATVLIMIITLFSIGSLIFAKAILNSTLSQIQDKVDVSVYFKTDSLEEDVFALKLNWKDWARLNQLNIFPENSLWKIL